MVIKKKLGFFFSAVLLIFTPFLKSGQQEPVYNLTKQGINLKYKIDHSKELVFGQSGSFSGHFKFYGMTIRNAIQACFLHVNSQGGIGGKKLRLISVEDGGVSEKTKENIEFMHQKLGISMFIGVMGTRGILSVLPLVREKKIAMFFPWGGHERLSDSKLTHIVNGFGLLKPQIEELVKYIVDERRLSNISIFHADGAFSTESAHTLKELLKNKGVTPVGMESYNRLTMAIEPSVDKLIEKDPRVVISVATSMPTVKLINRFFQKGHFGTLFFGIDSTFLVRDILQQKGVQFKFTSTVPDPLSSNIPLALEYRARHKHFFPKEDFSTLSFSYYVAARIIVHALEKLGKSTLFNKDKILDVLRGIKDQNLGGIPINFDENDNYIFGKKVWII